MASSSKRRLGIAAGFLVALAAVAALHIPFARPLRMQLGGCPMAGASKMTAVEMENARHMGVAGDRGSAPAPARPALGFVLDGSTLADVQAWSTRTHSDCDDPHPGLVICKDVQPEALGLDPSEGIIDQLALGFDTRLRLVNASTLRQHLAAETASRAARTIVASLQSTLGPADRHAGSFDAAALAQPGSAGISTVAYRFSDYVADVSTTNLGPTGPMLREHYMSARD